MMRSGQGDEDTNPDIYIRRTLSPKKPSCNQFEEASIDQSDIYSKNPNTDVYNIIMTIASKSNASVVARCPGLEPSAGQRVSFYHVQMGFLGPYRRDSGNTSFGPSRYRVHLWMRRP